MNPKPKGFMKYNVNIPTRVDVDALIEQIGIPEVGAHIPYSRIAEVIKVDRRTGRWSGVVEAWKRELRKKHGVELRAIANEGFEVLDDNGKTDKIVSHTTKAASQLKKAELVARITDRKKLTDENKRVYDHAMAFNAGCALVDRNLAKELNLPELDKAVANGAGS